MLIIDPGLQKKRIMIGYLAQGQAKSQRAQSSISTAKRFKLLSGSAFKAFAACPFPPEFSCPTYPGRPRPHQNDVRHKLRQLERLLLLHDLANPPVDSPAGLLDLLDPQSTAHKAVLGARARVSAPAPYRDGVRLHGPKVVAGPGELSAGEYAALGPWMSAWFASEAWFAGSSLWLAVEQVQQQGEICPELLDYAAE